MKLFQFSTVDSLALPWKKPRSERSPVVFTSREREVAILIAAGLNLRQIALQLGISYHTVFIHRRQIRSKLGYRDDAAIVQYVRVHFK